MMTASDFSDQINSPANLTLCAAARHLRRAARLLRRFAREHKPGCRCKGRECRPYPEFAADVRGIAWAVALHAGALEAVSMTPADVEEILNEYGRSLAAAADAPAVVAAPRE